MRILIIAISLALSSAALADDENLAQAKEDLALKETATELKDKCGVTPKATIDWKSFPKDYGNYSVSGYCGSGLDAIRRHCDGKAKKALIKKKLKSYTCKFGGKGKRGLTVKKGVVTFTLDFEAGNNDAFARKELLRSF
jgi:hypothetical protein